VGQRIEAVVFVAFQIDAGADARRIGFKYENLLATGRGFSCPAPV